MPYKPWEVVGTDLFQFNRKTYLIVIDYFSKFIETGIVEKLDAIHTINLLKSIFARHGIPKVIPSDNGTNYSSEQFKVFAKSWNIKHVTSLHAQSNGMVERCMQTYKNMMRKAEHDNKDPYFCILEYRTIPVHVNIPSPANLVFNREIKSLLPRFEIFKKEGGIVERTRSNLKERQVQQKEYYDRSSKVLKELKEKDEVNVQQKDKSWQPGKVIEKSKEKPRTYTVKLDSGTMLERNKKYLIKDAQTKKQLPFNVSPVKHTTVYRPKRVIKYPERYKDYEINNE